MKSKHLLLTLLLALFVPWAANAQQQTLTVYGGEGTTTNEYVPIYGYYADSKSKCEFIIPKEKISTMNGSVISAMKFYLDHSDNGDWYDDITATFEVFMKEVDATTLSGFIGNSDATTIFNNTITIEEGVSNVEIDIPFSTNYIYNGGNLLVGVYQTDAASSYNHTYWVGETQETNTAWGGYVNYASAQTFLPKTTFTYEMITTPTINLPASATVVTGFTTTLTASTLNVTGTPTITYTSNDTHVATVSGSGTSATVTGVAPGTCTITATMNYQGTNYTATCAITVEAPSYCSPTFGDPSDDYISNFTTTGGSTNINNSSTYVSGGYSDYYDTQSAEIEAGETLSCTVTPSSTQWTYGHAIWVDWNRNYEFETDERVAYSTAAATGNWTGEVAVPVTTTPGDYRLRVLHAYNASSVTDPCNSTTDYGEAEDYKLTVLAANPYQKPQGLEVSQLTNISATIVWTAPNTNVTGYKYQYKPEGGEWSALTSTTALSAPLDNLTSNTNYTFQVKAVYSNGESDFASKDFTTLYCNPADMCELSYELTTTSGYTSYGWYGSYIKVMDANTNEVLTTWTEDSGTGTTAGTFAVCEGRELHFEWYSANANNDQILIGSYAIYDRNGEEITSGTGPMTTSVNYTMDCTPLTCPKPTDLSKGTPTAHQVQLSWTENGSAQRWQICVNNDEENLILVTENPYTLGGLIGETDYTVKVRAYCDETDQSLWSNSVSFTTEVACEKPTNLEAITVGAKNAVITWEGENDSYDLRYKPDYTYHFEEGLGAWTSIDADGDGFTWRWSYGENGITGHNGGYCLYSQSYDNNGSQILYPDNYLVSPKVKLGGTISFYACAQDASWPAEHFGVAVSTTGNTSADDFTTIQEWTMTSNGTGTSGAKTMGTWGLFTVDLSAYEGEGYVAIRHFNCSDKFYLDIDDITIFEPGQVNDWTIVENITETPYTLPNLLETTTYEVQVRGYCTGEELPSAWTNSITFTTLSGNVFVTEGNWNVAANWQGGEVPAAGSDVIIAANATVPAGYTADAGNVTFDNSATITVADGGQFKTTYAGVNVTMQKHINGTDFGTPESPTNAGYYLLANPVSTVQVPATIGLTANSYDLYYFDNSQTGEQWRNYKDNTFNMGNTTGYLYANTNDLDIDFTGEVNVTSLTKKVELTYSSGELGGFCLVGNPYTCNAYLADSRPFYVIDTDGDEIIPATSNVIAPMMGLFVEITDDDNINFTTTEPAPAAAALNINLTSRNAQVDRAILSFGKGNDLRKFQLNPNHSKLYMPVEGNDYAVVYSEENVGEMPVSFKAENNGTYTISFNTENVEFSYLHLIDNMTGNDVNLLKTPNYTFDAKTTDYASRFRLVFATGSSVEEGNFGFINGMGNLCIFGIEGTATVQVVDVLGHVISSDTFSGSYEQKLNVAPGVYMIRLINGNDVKVQKIIVR